MSKEIAKKAPLPVRPWYVASYPAAHEITDADDTRLAEVFGFIPDPFGGNSRDSEYAERVAAHIVRCVNAHDDLVKAVKKLLHWAEEPSVALDAAAEFEDALKEGHAALAKCGENEEAHARRRQR